MIVDDHPIAALRTIANRKLQFDIGHAVLFLADDPFQAPLGQECGLLHLIPTSQAAPVRQKLHKH
ncbi:hypothetical protein A6X21_05520 [Planctopirus hydrillae]|uniref:Uncharacterized protein n=1 Tax=Planctopirus hydrillae TaxID=1841610 RepID=A0A1C3EBX1_9PLAN|nr:hypothetical protein A6X21_05520 [Planctopirus hydrillae]